MSLCARKKYKDRNERSGRGITVLDVGKIERSNKNWGRKGLKVGDILL